MRLSKKAAFILGITLMVFVVFLLYVWPIVTTVNADLNAYATRIAYKKNYKLHTTPLSQDVVNDLCSKLEIEVSSENCKPGAVVYAPDLFDEFKTYFESLPDQDKTYVTIQNHLEIYLDYCEKPDPDGYYTCRYDFRGDHVYPVFFSFDKDDHYYEVIAKWGGS